MIGYFEPEPASNCQLVKFVYQKGVFVHFNCTFLIQFDANMIKIMIDYQAT